MTTARRVTRHWVLRRRLAVQRLAGGPLRGPGDAVRLLTAVQAQDWPLAAWSIGMRSRPERYAAVLAAQAAGTIVRTHALRPTWHLVAAEDLRWLLRRTSAKVVNGMAARHRQLGVDDETVVGRAFDVLGSAVTGSRPRTRREMQAALAGAGLPSGNEQTGHLLLLAELRGLLCSGPPRGTEHTYALVDEVVPASPHDDLDRDAATDLLVHRFVAGHGPVSLADLGRWCGVTLAESTAAVRRLGGSVAAVECEGETLWLDPSPAPRASRTHAAYLLPTFDEVTLTYRTSGFPRREAAADRIRLVAESGGGTVVLGLQDVGTWKRTVTPRDVVVRVRPDVRLDADDMAAVEAAASRLGAFLERPTRLDLT